MALDFRRVLVRQAQTVDLERRLPRPALRRRPRWRGRRPNTRLHRQRIVGRQRAGLDQQAQQAMAPVG